ncbi:MAG: DUF5357 family protein [Synechococcales cyanobacterium M58_A2018_015]|nr:DUF5357 family protein [Synechococcales cyanobacterium M58_A2018_015]
MNNFFRFLFEVLLLKRFVALTKVLATRLQHWLNQVKAFPPTPILMLSLLSWVVYWLLQGEFPRRLVSILAWLFLIVGTDWALLNRTFTIPILDFKFQYRPWVVGLLTCFALWNYNFLIQDHRSLLVSWPIVSAFFAGYPKFLKTGPEWQIPDAKGRQDLVILLLLSGLYSCWFQFHFAIQDLLRQYPSLLSDEFDRSAFVVRVNPLQRRPLPRGNQFLEAAASAIQDELRPKTGSEAQTWLSNLESNLPAIQERALTQTYGMTPLRESRLWRLTAEPQLAEPDSRLLLRLTWTGPGLRGPYTLRKSCLVRNTTAQSRGSPVLECQAVELEPTALIPAS